MTAMENEDALEELFSSKNPVTTLREDKATQTGLKPDPKPKPKTQSGIRKTFEKLLTLPKVKTTKVDIESNIEENESLLGQTVVKDENDKRPPSLPSTIMKSVIVETHSSKAK